MSSPDSSRSENRIVPSSETFAERYRHFPQATPDFHRVWYQALDDPAVDRLLILAPREHAKTSVVLTYVVRSIVAYRSIRVGLVSATEQLALAFLRDVRRELESPHLTQAFPPALKPERPVRWTDHEFIVEGAVGIGKDATCFALGAGGQVTGRHADLIICDDLERSETVTTAELRAKTRQWFARELLPVLSPGGKCVVLGTHKHHDDLYAWLEKDAL